ncbi:MAG: LysR substrate-binding domain-containing protein [Gammaproteobacteria bacterium]|jgi:LysR family hydrogen peroxide-inducible transcriptional activator|nr:LysR substrate-binding domain-containing protein [Gammaproteobacteria bacterium]
MITLKQLSYALAAEKTLHFKNAAELCNISQSALSTALNEMEKQLGFQIFERNNKKVLITPIGREVLQYSRNILLQVEELQHLAERNKAALSYPITIGVIPTIAPFLLPKIFPLLNKIYPQAQLTIVEEHSAALIDMVKKGDIDTAILALPFPCDGLLQMEFWQEDFYWITLKDDKNTQQKIASKEEIKQSKLLLLKDGHCLRDNILEVCKLSETAPSNTLGATSLNTLIQMVLGKLGTTLIPEMALDPLIAQNPLLNAIHIDEPGPHRRIAFVIRPNYTRMTSIEALMELCETALQESAK